MIVEFEEQVPDFVLPHSVLRKSEGRKKWFAFNRFETPVSDLIASVSARFPIADLTVEEQEIEQVIRSIYLDHAERMQEK